MHTGAVIRLKAIIEESDTRIGRLFDWSVQGLILLSIVVFSLETLPDLPQGLKQVLFVTEMVIITLFAIEYVLRVVVADSKRGYIFSFYGIVDFVATLPFFLLVGMDLSSLRAVRLIRLARLLKLFRYNDALQRYGRAILSVKEEFIIFCLVTLVLLYLAAVGIYYFERDAQPEVFGSVFHSLWWSVATLTTVGYGDVYPLTLGGRIFTFFILMIGLGVVAVPAGLLSSALTNVRQSQTDGAQSQPGGGPGS